VAVVVALESDRRMMLDAALGITLIVALVTAMSACFEIPRELREQTAQLMLAKPLGRTQFLIGKFLGICMLAVFNIAIVGIGSALVIRLRFSGVPPSYYSGCVLAVGEAVLLAAVGILLSLWMRDALAVVVLFVVFALGHSLYLVPLAFPTGLSHKIAAFTATALPNLHHLDFKSIIAGKIEIGRSAILPALTYAVTYAVAVLAAAVAVFQRRDIA